MRGNWKRVYRKCSVILLQKNVWGLLVLRENSMQLSSWGNNVNQNRKRRRNMDLNWENDWKWKGINISKQRLSTRCINITLYTPLPYSFNFLLLHSYFLLFLTFQRRSDHKIFLKSLFLCKSVPKDSSVRSIIILKKKSR